MLSNSFGLDGSDTDSTSSAGRRSILPDYMHGGNMGLANMALVPHRLGGAPGMGFDPNGFDPYLDPMAVHMAAAMGHDAMDLTPLIGCLPADSAASARQGGAGGMRNPSAPELHIPNLKYETDLQLSPRLSRVHDMYPGMGQGPMAPPSGPARRYTSGGCAGGPGPASSGLNIRSSMGMQGSPNLGNMAMHNTAASKSQQSLFDRLRAATGGRGRPGQGSYGSDPLLPDLGSLGIMGDGYGGLGCNSLSAGGRMGQPAGSLDSSMEATQTAFAVGSRQSYQTNGLTSMPNLYECVDYIDDQQLANMLEIESQGLASQMRSHRIAQLQQSAMAAAIGSPQLDPTGSGGQEMMNAGSPGGQGRATSQANGALGSPVLLASPDLKPLPARASVDIGAMQHSSGMPQESPDGFGKRKLKRSSSQNWSDMYSQQSQHSMPKRNTSFRQSAPGGQWCGGQWGCNEWGCMSG